MLKSYEAIYNHGKIEWLSEPPAGERFHVLVVVEQPEENRSAPPIKRRVPPPELKGSVQWAGNPLESLYPEDEPVSTRSGEISSDKY